MNVIIIDDDSMSRALIAQMLSIYSQINVANEFSNAISAIKYLNQEQIDLIPDRKITPAKLIFLCEKYDTQQVEDLLNILLSN